MPAVGSGVGPVQWGIHQSRLYPAESRWLLPLPLHVACRWFVSWLEGRGGPSGVYV